MFKLLYNTGYESFMRPSEINYSNHCDFYIDVANGELLEGVEQATEYIDTQTATSDVRKLGSLVREHDYVKKLDLERLDVSNWPRDKYIEYGKWMAGIVIPSHKQERHLSRSVFNSAFRLGIGPSLHQIRSNIGSLSDLYTTIKAPSTRIHGVFDEWSIDDYVAYIKQVGGAKRPTIDQINRPSRKDSTLPRAEYITSKFESIGGLNRLLELAGYPVYENWEPEDFINWGVKFTEANHGLLLTSRMADYLSLKRLGPAGSTIRNKFGKHGAFQKLIIEAYHAREGERKRDKEVKLGNLKRDIDRGVVPSALLFVKKGDREEDVTTKQFSTDEIDQKFRDTDDKILITRYAKFSVLNEVAKESTLWSRIKIAADLIPGKSFIGSIQKLSWASPGAVESSALWLGFYDDIWPDDAHIVKLELDNRYINYYKRIEGVKEPRGPHVQTLKVASVK